MYQKEATIYPRAVKGWFATWRWVLVWLTQLLFYGLPWLQWGGRQAVLFDLEAQRFYLFGLVLYPQDLIFLAALLVLSALALFFFTAVAGRLWCGYACPQTVYTEIFMWIERRIEGDRPQRMKRDAAGWTLDRTWRALAKHAAWIAIALWTGFTFVGYFTPIRELGTAALTLGFGPWEWFWVLFYGFATYGNAGSNSGAPGSPVASCSTAKSAVLPLSKAWLLISSDLLRASNAIPAGLSSGIVSPGWLLNRIVSVPSAASTEIWLVNASETYRSPRAPKASWSGSSLAV